MNKKSLMETNPYLRDRKKYEKLLFINVASSSAIEVGSLSTAIVKALKDETFPLLIKTDIRK